MVSAEAAPAGGDQLRQLASLRLGDGHPARGRRDEGRRRQAEREAEPAGLRDAIPP